jgi:hypothetical protein
MQSSHTPASSRASILLRCFVFAMFAKHVTLQSTTKSSPQNSRAVFVTSRWILSGRMESKRGGQVREREGGCVVTPYCSLRQVTILCRPTFNQHCTSCWMMRQITKRSCAYLLESMGDFEAIRADCSAHAAPCVLSTHPHQLYSVRVCL